MDFSHPFGTMVLRKMTAGVEEASVAMEEGRLAGVDMAQKLGYLSQDKAARKKTEVKESLFALRSRPFGYQCQRAKLEIIGKAKLNRRK